MKDTAEVQEFHNALVQALYERGVIFVDDSYFDGLSLEELKDLLDDWYPEEIWQPALNRATQLIRK